MRRWLTLRPITLNPTPLMRKFTLLLLLVQGIAVAQKVDLDRGRFSLTFRHLPENPLPFEYQTYQLDFIPQLDLDEISQRKDLAAMQIKLGDGFQAVKDNQDVLVSVKIEEFHFVDMVQRSRTETQKGADGKEVKTTSYYMGGQLELPVYLVVVDGKTAKSIHQTRIVPLSAMKPYETPAFKSAAELSTYWQKEQNNTRKTLKRQCFDEALQAVNADLKRRYGYHETGGGDHLWILDSKKHPEYEAYQQQWQVAKKALESIRFNQPLDAAKAQLQPVLAYFDALKTKYMADEKADRKLRYSAYYNAALIRYWLDEPDASIADAEGLIKNDYDTSDGKNIIRTNNYLKESLAQSKRDSRHFAIPAMSAPSASKP